MQFLQPAAQTVPRVRHGPAVCGFRRGGSGWHVPCINPDDEAAESRRSVAAAGTDMTIHLAFQPLIALLAGILILVVLRLLNYVVAGYLILVGVAGLVGV